MLEYFKNKFCTVFTTPINRNFKEENPGTYPKQIFTYFAGMVEDVSPEGIMLTQFNTGLKTFLFKSHIVGIAEEQMLDPDDPQHKEIIEKFKQESNTAQELMKKADAETIQPDALSNISNYFKNKYAN